MAKITYDGLGNLMSDMEELAKLPDFVVDDMLNAAADVVVEEQRKTGQQMLNGPYATGTTAGSVKKGKVKKSGTSRSIEITPEGSNSRGTRNAEVAFINEFGKRGQPARPWIKTANERAESKAVEAQQKIMDDFISSKNL